MCWCLRKFPSSMSLLSAKGRSQSGFKRRRLIGLKIENTPGYEDMELEMWPFQAEVERAVRRMTDGKRAVWYHSCIWVETRWFSWGRGTAKQL